jgi:hypothetical protein
MEKLKEKPTNNQLRTELATSRGATLARLCAA